MFATPNVVIEHSRLGHRPKEARLATSACALQGRYKTDSDDLALSRPRKFVRMFFRRPGTLASFVPYIRSIFASAALKASLIATSGRPRSTVTPTTCAAPVTQPPAILPPGFVLRECHARIGLSWWSRTHIRMSDSISVDRRNNATAPSKELASRAEHSAAIGASLRC